MTTPVPPSPFAEPAPAHRLERAADGLAEQQHGAMPRIGLRVEDEQPG